MSRADGGCGWEPSGIVRVVGDRDDRARLMDWHSAGDRELWLGFFWSLFAATTLRYHATTDARPAPQRDNCDSIALLLRCRRGMHHFISYLRNFSNGPTQVPVPSSQMLLRTLHLPTVVA